MAQASSTIEQQTTILVVDDDFVIRRMLLVLLRSLGYAVVEACNGIQALEALKQHPVQGILLDIMMPKMDGYEVCKQVKGDPATRHIPVMMVTAFSSQADRQRALEVGADDFVRKPINLENLVAVIQKTVPHGKNERGSPHDE